MSDRVFDLDLLEDSSIIKLDKKSVADGPLLGIMIVHAEALLFDAVNLGTEGIDARVGGCLVGASLDTSVPPGNVLQGEVTD